MREAPADVDRFVFVHTLVREGLSEQHLASRRVRLHHGIGLALERLAARYATAPAELAHHFFESRHLDREGKAIDYSVKAAEQAAEMFSFEQAARHYRQALAAIEARVEPDTARRCSLMLGLGEA